MSIQDLKAKLQDVPGIASLSMTMIGGKQIYVFDRHTVALDASAGDSDVMQAIRAAVSPAPSSAAPIPVPAPTAGDAAVMGAAASPSPSTPKATSQMTTSPASHGLTIKEMMEAHAQKLSQIHDAQIALLQASLDRQAQAVSSAVSTVASKIDSQTDDFLSMLGQYSNLDV